MQVDKDAIQERDGHVTLRVRVQPKASQNAIRVDETGRLRVSLTAPPVEGAANKALREFIAKELGIPKSAASLVSGEKSREKTLRVEGVARSAVEAKLKRWIGDE